MLQILGLWFLRAVRPLLPPEGHLSTSGDLSGCFQSASLEREDAGFWEHRDLFSLTLKYASAEFRYMCYEVTLELVKAEKLN